MLYHLNEMSHAAAAPLLWWSQVGSKLFSHPYSALSYAPLSRNFAASCELFSRIVQRYDKPEFGITETTVKGKTVAVTQTIALSKPFCNLQHFQRAVKNNDPKVLIVAPLSGHHSTLLRDTVRTFLPDHDVYITDWIDARMVPIHDGAFHFDDYVSYVKEFIRYLGDGVHVVSVCQPTVPVLAAVSLMAQAGEKITPRSMTMMGGPIDARRSPTSVNSYAREKPIQWFEKHVIARVPMRYPGAGRRVYPGFLQHMGFVAMNPDKHIQSHWDFFDHLLQGDGESASEHRKFYDEYNAVLDMPADYYLETVKMVFQDFDLAKGNMRVAGELVKPETIKKTALLTVEGELDDISGGGQTSAAQQLCKGIPNTRKHHYDAEQCGHYGIFSGRRFREKIYPNIRTFIRKYD
ncbi:MAG: polyhydroxyalkanoate depolymerase [Burkholderiales bacterium]